MHYKEYVLHKNKYFPYGTLLPIGLPPGVSIKSRLNIQLRRFVVILLSHLLSRNENGTEAQRTWIAVHLCFDKVAV
eukprot:1240159-Ditylum_brightwellii.AAC.1